MKTTLLIVLLAFCSVANAQTTNPAPECPHEYDDGVAPKVHYISSVQIGNFINVSGHVQQPAPHYIFYNNLSPINFVIGQTYNYTIQIDSGGDNRLVYIWNDWNVNGIYEVSEVYYNASVPAGVTSVSGIFNVPFATSTGTRRMRVAISEDTTQSSMVFCTTTLDWGEAEDYEVQVTLTAGIDNVLADDSGISLFPNPATDFLNLKTEYKGINRIHIYSVNGQMVFEKAYNGEKEVTLSMKDLPPGTYNASIQTGDRITSRSFAKKE